MCLERKGGNFSNELNSLTLYVSKKEAWSCFGDSAQISGNRSRGLVYNIRMSYHFLP